MRTIGLFSIGLLIISGSCTNSNKEMETSEENKISAADLIRIGFNKAVNDTAVQDSLWAVSQNGAALKQIVLSKSENTDARFIAAEMLFSKDENWMSSNGPETADAIAELYTAALNANNYDGYLWGDPGKETWPSPASSHLLSTGEKSLKYLQPLLGNDSALHYFWSDYNEPDYKYRVCDIAAALISKLKNIQFPDELSAEKHDLFIKELSH